MTRRQPHSDELTGLSEGVRRGTEALGIVYPVIQALRAWRDAENSPRHPRAIQEAENQVLTELRYFEERAEFLRSQESQKP